MLVTRLPEGRWRAHVVDLDGARLAAAAVSPRRRVAEVLRLCRSIDKWTPTAATPGASRDAFLREKCGDDRELKEEVESLLLHFEAADSRFLAGGAFQIPDDPTQAAPAAPRRYTSQLGGASNSE